MAKREVQERQRSATQIDPRSTSTSSPASLWVLGPARDLALIIGSPLLVLIALTVVSRVWSNAVMASMVMVWAVGHHLPGMLRAYGDAQLFRRFRVRFIVAPLVLILICIWAFRTDFKYGLLSVTAVWGWWHYLMQAYGFARIYDSKVGSFAPTTRYLDQAMCLTWFGAAVILNDNSLYGFVSNLYFSGLPVPSETVFRVLRGVAYGATLGVTLLFLVNLAGQYRRGERISMAKILLMMASFGSFWYSAASVTNLLVAYAFFEIFHDMQYLTIVWAFNRRRVEKEPNLGGFTQFLFRPRAILVTLYLILVFGYGSLKYASTLVEDQAAARLLMAVFLTSTLLHYYFDGFIWKLRESSTQQALEVKSASGAGSALALPPRTASRHLALWGLFLVPFAVLTVLQVNEFVEQQKRNGLDQTRQLQEFAAEVQRRQDDAEHLARMMPKSVRAQSTALFCRGFAQEVAGAKDRALADYRRALAQDPTLPLAREGLERLMATLPQTSLPH